MKTMRVLITCEKSGIVRRSFSARGHDTWSMEWIARTMRSDERRAVMLLAMQIIKQRREK